MDCDWTDERDCYDFKYSFLRLNGPAGLSKYDNYLSGPEENGSSVPDLKKYEELIDEFIADAQSAVEEEMTPRSVVQSQARQLWFKKNKKLAVRVVYSVRKGTKIAEYVIVQGVYDLNQAADEEQAPRVDIIRVSAATYMDWVDKMLPLAVPLYFFSLV